MDLTLWKKVKKEKKMTIEEIAEKSGLPKGSVQNIFAGYVPNPRIDTVKAIESALGISSWTEEELAQGISPIVVRNLTPDEDELLELFRELGEKKGGKAQETIKKLLEDMVNM